MLNKLKVIDLNGKGFFKKYFSENEKFKDLKVIVYKANNDKEFDAYCLNNKNQILQIICNNFIGGYLKTGDISGLDRDWVRSLKEKRHPDIFKKLCENGYTDLEYNKEELEEYTIQKYEKVFGEGCLERLGIYSTLEKDGNIKNHTSISLTFKKIRLPNYNSINYCMGAVGKTKEEADLKFKKEVLSDIKRILKRDFKFSEKEIKELTNNI